MKFQLLHSDTQSAARAGWVETDHGVIETPIFMPVGTIGTVKAVSQQSLVNEVEAQIILGNTYHLYLRPGMDTMQAAGGLHKFMNWQKPILTDSGGYQVYSLSHNRKLTEEGAIFQSHLDGSKHLFTPENVVDTQRKIGSDIMMVLDECTPYPCDYQYAKKSLGLTHRWAERCKTHWLNTEPLYGHSQTLFPIVQGSVFPDLRRESAAFIANLDMEGNAIGGLSVGEPAEDMYAMTEEVCAILPAHKPRYLMGVGTPENILECIALGVDMFDCVMPTRNARHGLLFTKDGIRNIKNAKYAQDFSPIDDSSDYIGDQFYTKAYLRHLFKCDELLAYQIASVHNLHFYLWLVKEARKHILAGDFASWKKDMVLRVKQKL